MEPIQMVFFEPQTGIFKRRSWESNFYQHRLRNSRGKEGKTIDWIKENIAKATVGSDGLQYPPNFLKEVAAFEARTDKDVERLLNICNKLEDRTTIDAIPRRQDGKLCESDNGQWD